MIDEALHSLNAPASAAILDEARSAFARGDVARTEQLCKSLVATAPNNAGAWMLLAETAALRDRPDAAVLCAYRAAKLAPRDPLAWILSAKALLRRGDLVEALEAAEKADPLVGEDPAAADALAALFGLLGHHLRALGLSRRAVAARPEIAQFHYNLAATLRMLGQLPEAQQHCDRAIACDRKFARAYYLRSDLRTQTRERNNVADLEAAIAATGDDWRAKIMLHYALAKELEDLEEHAGAFRQVRAGAELHKRFVKSDCATEIGRIDGIIRSQTKDWLETAREGDRSCSPIFVVGLPRTGTTLIERIVTSHSAVTSVGETNVFARLAADRAGEAVLLQDCDLRELGQGYAAVVERVYQTGGKRFVDKTLQNYLYCGLIHAALPFAKIILVRRDPLDAGWALYKAHFQQGFTFSYDLEELADYCVAYERLVAHWRHTLPSRTLLEVAYEDVVRDQEGESRRIIGFLNLPWENEVLRFYESRSPSATASAVQVRQPIYASSIGKWRQHEQVLEPFRNRFGVIRSDSDISRQNLGWSSSS
jgi:Flp pilus assembly protein TadD